MGGSLSRIEAADSLLARPAKFAAGGPYRSVQPGAVTESMLVRDDGRDARVYGRAVWVVGKGLKSLPIFAADAGPLRKGSVCLGDGTSEG